MSPSLMKKTAGPKEPPAAAAQVGRQPRGTENTAEGAAPPCLSAQEASLGSGDFQQLWLPTHGAPVTDPACRQEDWRGAGWGGAGQ